MQFANSKNCFRSLFGILILCLEVSSVDCQVQDENHYQEKCNAQVLWKAIHHTHSGLQKYSSNISGTYEKASYIKLCGTLTKHGEC